MRDVAVDYALYVPHASWGMCRCDEILLHHFRDRRMAGRLIRGSQTIRGANTPANAEDSAQWAHGSAGPERDSMSLDQAQSNATSAGTGSWNADRGLPRPRSSEERVHVTADTVG